VLLINPTEHAGSAQLWFVLTSSVEARGWELSADHTIASFCKDKENFWYLIGAILQISDTDKAN
jgi:hypothetical protein